ncbi:hypothetical protein [Paenibacillus sp. 481]|uniref:hypothetical protein n=1 Tax=Paenibacillus sp. 481 TaxID=2835869 RepID=UPI001E2CDAAE|nr:hypothetical protein [Paenibacillus sp. 481]UHA75549.1 hypothetical protein KIK04_11465 [Paenibacillus sp. 481]
MDCCYCHGNGDLNCTECEGTGSIMEGGHCSSCSGHGTNPCLRCNGSGRLDYDYNEQDSIASILQSMYFSPNFSRGR